MQTVQEELSKALDRHKSLSNNVSRLYLCLYGTSLLIPDVTSYQLEERLKQLCERIIASAQKIEKNPVFYSLGMERLIERRAPSSKGKPEAKDCTIFEEALGLGRELR